MKNYNNNNQQTTKNMKTKNIINCIALLVVAVVIIAADSLNFVTGIASAAVICGLAVLVNNVNADEQSEKQK